MEQPAPGTAETFLPSKHGFAFANSWPKQPAVVLPAPFGRIGIGDASKGLCGGMVFAAADYFHAGRRPPAKRPAAGERLYRYIVRRILHSWRLPTGVLRYYRWMLLPDGEAARRTAEGQWPAIAAELDRGTPVPLGLVTVASASPAQLRHNHQVLAYAYQRRGPRIAVRVYDPNRGPRDDIAVQFDTGGSEDAPHLDHNLGIKRPVRGFFRVGYAPRLPPE